MNYLLEWATLKYMKIPLSMDQLPTNNSCHLILSSGPQFSGNCKWLRIYERWPQTTTAKNIGNFFAPWIIDKLLLTSSTDISSDALIMGSGQHQQRIRWLVVVRRLVSTTTRRWRGRRQHWKTVKFDRPWWSAVNCLLINWIKLVTVQIYTNPERDGLGFSQEVGVKTIPKD